MIRKLLGSLITDKDIEIYDAELEEIMETKHCNKELAEIYWGRMKSFDMTQQKADYFDKYIAE